MQGMRVKEEYDRLTKHILQIIAKYSEAKDVDSRHIVAMYSQMLLIPSEISLLEHILDNDSKKLCPKKDLELMLGQKEKFSKNQLNEMLNESKEYVDGMLGDVHRIPKIGPPSIFDPRDSARKSVNSFCIGTLASLPGILALLAGAPTSLLSMPFFMLAGYFAGIGYEHYRHNNKSIDHIGQKITIARMNKLFAPGAITHEYVHHSISSRKCEDMIYHEGLARTLQVIFDEELAIRNNNQAYNYYSAWQSCRELYDIYKRLCIANGKKPHKFLPTNNCIKPGIIYSLGRTAFRMLDEKGYRISPQNY